MDRLLSRRGAALLVALLVPAGFAGSGLPTSAAARPETAAPLRSFTLAAVGDVLVEEAVWVSAAKFAKGTGLRYDFRPMFAPTASLIGGADLAICHLETPVGRPGVRPGRYGKTPLNGNRILAAFEIVPAIDEAGFDRCSTASNHSLDLGDQGISDTLDILDSFGIGHTGTARSEAESRPAVITVNGVKVGHLAWSRRSNSLPAKDPWRFNFASIPKIVSEVNRLRSAGAEVVVLSLHQGQELQQKPTAEQRTWLDQLLAAAPIDVVISHHAHVVQPVERIHGALVFWGVGNFLSGMGPGRTYYSSPKTLDGLLALVQFTETSPGVFETTPSPIALCSEQKTRVVYPVVSTLASSATPPALRQQLTACLTRIRKVVPSAG